MSLPERSNWLLYPVDLTFILQDPDSEAGSTETEASKVRDSYVYLNNRAYLLLAAVMADVFLFICNSCVEVSWEQIEKVLH